MGESLNVGHVIPHGRGKLIYLSLLTFHLRLAEQEVGKSVKEEVRMTEVSGSEDRRQRSGSRRHRSRKSEAWSREITPFLPVPESPGLRLFSVELFS